MVEVSHWQVQRAACWPFPPKNPGDRRQICRNFYRFTGRVRELYPDFDVAVTRHSDRRLRSNSIYILKTGVMISYAAKPAAVEI